MTNSAGENESLNRKNKECVLQLIPNLGAGGAQRAFHDQSSLLAETFEVIKVAFNLDGSLQGESSQHTVRSLEVPAGKSPLGKFINLFRRALRLRELAKVTQAKICISHMDGANWVNVLSRSRAKKILVVHGSIFGDKDIPKWIHLLRTRILIPVLYNRADMAVAVSEGIARELREQCGVKKVVAINNFFDTALISRKATEPLAKEEEVLFSNSNVLVSAGRLHPQKNQIALLEIISQIRLQIPNAKLVLLGEGRMLGELVDYSRHLNLRTFVQNRTIDRACFQDFDVYFMGNVSNPFSFMSRASLFLFPSEWEGFPLAMVEAMIVGVPVLASDCRTGPREILCPRGTLTGYDIQTAEFTGAGVLLPIPRTKAQIDLWSAVVLELISAPARRRSMIRGAALRAAHFDRDVVFGKWRELIGSLSTHQD